MKAIIIHCHDNVNLAADIQIVIINSRLQARNNEKPIRTKTRSKETGTLGGAFSLLITEDILSQIIVNANISVNICNVDIYQIPPTTLSLSVSLCLSVSLSLSVSLRAFLGLLYRSMVYSKDLYHTLFVLYRMLINQAKMIKMILWPSSMCLKLMNPQNMWCKSYQIIVTYGTKYSRMDQVRFVGDSL